MRVCWSWKNSWKNDSVIDWLMAPVMFVDDVAMLEDDSESNTRKANCRQRICEQLKELYILKKAITLVVLLCVEG